jgi:hypothetical protein
MQLTRWEKIEIETHLVERSCQMNFLIDHDPHGVDLWRDEKARLERLIARIQHAVIVEEH